MKNAVHNATIYDVAKLANVSLATVSRVVNGIDKVAEDTKKKVLEAIEQLNYKPNALAKDLAMSKTTNVAIIVPVLNYTYVAHVVAGLMDTAKQYGYDCLIFTTQEEDDVLQTLEKVMSLRVNGVIIFNDRLSNDRLQSLINYDIPIVTLGTDLKTISSVTWHYKNQIRLITDHCLNETHKEVYFISVANSGRMEERMLNAIKEEYSKTGKKFNNIIEVEDSYQAAYNKLQEFYQNQKRCYIIAERDSIAIAALNAAIDSNLNVPEDIEVMAVIGTKYSELVRPKLSSFDIDMRGMGKKGMELLAKAIENKKEIITEKLNFDFIKRGTTL